MSRHTRIDKDQIVRTLQTLTVRIDERFPKSGLLGVCESLLEVACRVEADLQYIARPNWFLRAFIFFFISLVTSAMFYSFSRLDIGATGMKLGEFVQISEAALNEIVLISGAIIFIVSIETRTKRRRVIESINKLRSVAHVIDMHQLTKDPSVLLNAHRGKDRNTKTSPKREMTLFQLNRYLDYCTEMLSLTSKVAFLYVQDFSDADAVDAVNDLENLTNGLSRKVWQKIMLIPIEGHQ